MLPSLAIQNFKLFKELNIPSLGQVNLIAGENNTGKTALLEAISIYGNNINNSRLISAFSDYGDSTNISHIVNILEDRGEYVASSSNSEVEALILNTYAISSFFFDRDIYRTIFIGEKDGYNIVLNIEQTSEEKIEQKDGSILIRKKYSPLSPKSSNNTDIGLKILTSKIQEHYFSVIHGLDETFRSSKDDSYSSNCHFANAREIDKDNMSQLWSRIALTEKEQLVIDALKIINPNIDRLTFIEQPSARKQYKAVVRIGKEIYPIRSMGDGINRILTIILSLVNCANGYLLIDEFENGLHYSVQKQLWEIIFKIAKEQNTQVFVTTHSTDSIRSFAEVANQEKEVDAKYIRLEKDNDNFIAVEYSTKELLVAAEQNIETR